MASDNLYLEQQVGGQCWPLSHAHRVILLPKHWKSGSRDSERTQISAMQRKPGWLKSLQRFVSQGVLAPLTPHCGGALHLRQPAPEKEGHRGSPDLRQQLSLNSCSQTPWPPVPASSTTQLCNKSNGEWIQHTNRHELGVIPSTTADTTEVSIGPLWVHRPHYFRNHLLWGQGMHSKATQPSGLLLQQREEILPLLLSAQNKPPTQNTGHTQFT